MLYSMCDKSRQPPSWPQLQHAIRRNFGGLESKQIKPFEVFCNEIDYIDIDQDFSELDEEVLPLTIDTYHMPINVML